MFQTGEAEPRARAISLMFRCRRRIDHPYFQSAPITTVNTGADYLYAPAVLDLDGDTLQFFLDDGPTGMTIDANTGVVQYPTASNGTHPVSIRVEDGREGNAVQAFVLSVGVTSTNPGAPVFRTLPPTEAIASSLYLYLPFAEDPDGDVLTFSLTEAPTGMQANSSTGRIDWIPDATQLGPHTVLLKVDDGNGGMATQFYTINVADSLLNRPPVITSLPNFIAAHDQLYSYQVTVLDPDGDAISFQLSDAPAGMTNRCDRWRSVVDSDCCGHRVSSSADSGSRPRRSPWRSNV